jgi:hypothetical protein
MSMVQIHDREEWRALLNVAQNYDVVLDSEGQPYVFNRIYWMAEGHLFFPEELLNKLPVSVPASMVDRLLLSNGLVKEQVQ